MSTDTQEKLTELTAGITAVVGTITTLITFGKTAYPYVIALFSTLKDFIVELSTEVDGAVEALSAVIAGINKVVEALKTKLAEDGLVSDETLAEWLAEIDANIAAIEYAAKD